MRPTPAARGPASQGDSAWASLYRRPIRPAIYARVVRLTPTGTTPSRRPGPEVIRSEEPPTITSAHRPAVGLSRA